MADKVLTIKIQSDTAGIKAGVAESVAALGKVDQAATKTAATQKTAASDVAKAVEKAETAKRDSAGRFVKDQLAGLATVKAETSKTTNAGVAGWDALGKSGVGSMIGIGASSALATAGLQKLKMMADQVQAAISKAADESRRLASGLTSDRDRQRELAATLGVKADSRFAVENAKFGKDAAMRLDEAVVFRNQLANSGVQFKGQNLTDEGYGQYEKKAAALATARGLASDIAGDFFGGVLGLKNYGKALDAPDQALAVGNRQLAILGQGRGEQAVLARQMAMVNASMFSDEAFRGSITSPEEAASLVSVAAEKSPSEAHEMLEATNRGLTDYNDPKTGPLLQQAKVKSGMSIIEKLKLIKPIIEANARAGGRTVEEEVSKSFPDLRTARGVSVYLNKGLEGGLFEKRKALGESLRGTAPALGMISEFQASETGRARIADADVKLSETVRGAENSRIDVVNRQALAKLIREKRIDTTDANVNDFLRGLIPFASIDSGKQQRISDEAASLIDMRAKEVGVPEINRFVLTDEDRARNYNRTIDAIEGTGKNPLDLSRMETLLEQNNALLQRFLPTVAPPVKGAPPALPAGPAPAMRR